MRVPDLLCHHIVYSCEQRALDIFDCSCLPLLSSCLVRSPPENNDEIQDSEVEIQALESQVCYHIVPVPKCKTLSGAVNRSFWTCGSFADFVAGTALFLNLEVQISWQVQRFVNLEVLVSWQAQHFVNL